MGAITYQPSSNESESSLFDIQEVAKNSIDIFEGATQDILPSLARAGGSAGGARPKVLVGISGNSMISGESSLPDGYDPWLIKFAAKQDLKTAGKMEYMYYRMAIDAGLEMTESKLFPVGENVFFGTKRFDRVEGQPVHMHSVANLIDADFRTPSLDYDDLMKITRILTKSNDDIKMMFRLMVFNIAIGNQDDHAKNFSFLMNNSGEWRLSPSYDLTKSIGFGNEHSTSVGGKGKNIERKDLLKIADHHSIPLEAANEIIDSIENIIRTESDYEKSVEDYSNALTSECDNGSSGIGD